MFLPRSYTKIFKQALNTNRPELRIHMNLTYYAEIKYLVLFM